MWLFSKKIDFTFLYLPVWAIWIICFAVPNGLHQTQFPIWLWVLTVLAIDVTHVWSTIFRTYLDKEEFNNHQELLTLTPVVSFLVLYSISSYSIDLYWRILAYFALFHFIKQQYGFLILYKYKARDFCTKIFRDKWVIYYSMLYPVVFWHISGDRTFSWFVEGDFILYYNSDIVHAVTILNTIYWVIILGWLAEEIYSTKKNGKPLNTGKILWVLTTAINWYLGIVYFNSDLAFTLTNVVAHGVPYMVLIFYYEKKKNHIRKIASKPILLMLLMILGLGFIEEYFWDSLINRDKISFFDSVIPYTYEALNNDLVIAAFTALLSVPQITHYVVDGFIWKSNKKNMYLKQVFK